MTPAAPPAPGRVHPSRTDDPGAGDAQAACAEVAARMVVLEEALITLLAGDKNSEDKARRALAYGRP